jgi:hypothetical protein
MEISGLGGGLMFAAAAGLWMVYLMPTWFKRREYLATERNAVRLQQTLRVLAETSEVPAIVRVETSVRSIAEQERALRDQQAAAVARARVANAAYRERASLPPSQQRRNGEAPGEGDQHRNPFEPESAPLPHFAPPAPPAPPERHVAPPAVPHAVPHVAQRTAPGSVRVGTHTSRPAPQGREPQGREPQGRAQHESSTPDPRSIEIPIVARARVAAPLSPRVQMARRIRRSRAAASLLTLVSLAVALVQLVVVLFGGGVSSTWAVFGFCTIGVVTGLAALARLATVARRRVSSVQVGIPRATRQRTRTRMQDFAPVASRTVAPVSVEWTPVPVPKPLYLSRTVLPNPPLAVDDPFEELRAAAAAADRSLRAVHASPKGAPILTLVPDLAPDPDPNNAAHLVPHPASGVPAGTTPDAGPAGASASPSLIASASPTSAATAAAASPVRTAPPSRFARMGIVDPTDVAGTDIDAALRRRRTGS